MAGGGILSLLPYDAVLLGSGTCWPWAGAAKGLKEANWPQVSRFPLCLLIAPLGKAVRAGGRCRLCHLNDAALGCERAGLVLCRILLCSEVVCSTPEGTVSEAGCWQGWRAALPYT